jgi:prepilin-type N-terminal cleavage/methylation domain-containing protein
MKRPKGFSLVEMLVVLTVVSILALLAVAGFSSTREANIANGAQMVKGALKLARQIAVAQNRVTEVRFYRKGG